MDLTHRYQLTVVWTGNLGTGTSGYEDYGRCHRISARGKPEIEGSSDPVFRGDPSAYNPEELLVAALSACHMLWFLHLCSEAGVVVTDYTDQPEGWMQEESDGSGRFTGVVLRPSVRLACQDAKDRLTGLHAQAHAMCFIAKSVNFPVHVLPEDGTPLKR
ncbi:MAG: OsmC family protein [Saprospiraceae bacterium]|nr:OsmC family protein [Saprospiraceae bacterium]